MLTATATGASARRNKAPASTASAASFRTSSSVHRPHSDICDNQEDSNSFDSLFLSVPSPAQVQGAIASLRSLMQGISLCGTELSWLHPILSLYETRLTHSPGFQRLKDALLLLETDQSVQRLVLSISSDKSVWDAVLKNKLVIKLRESLRIDKFEGSPGNEAEPDVMASIIRWILGMMKAKIVELVEKFRSLVDEIFETAPQKDRVSAESRECLEEKLKSSVMLSIVILLIVVVTRASHL